MDPLERAIEALKRQKKILGDETEECSLLLRDTRDADEKREYKGIIKRNKAAIEGFAYVLNFCENLKEEPCQD